jgi:hypothetical protein
VSKKHHPAQGHPVETAAPVPPNPSLPNPTQDSPDAQPGAPVPIKLGHVRPDLAVDGDMSSVRQSPLSGGVLPDAMIAPVSDGQRQSPLGGNQFPSVTEVAQPKPTDEEQNK